MSKKYRNKNKKMSISDEIVEEQKIHKYFRDLVEAKKNNPNFKGIKDCSEHEDFSAFGSDGFSEKRAKAIINYVSSVGVKEGE